MATPTVCGLIEIDPSRLPNRHPGHFILLVPKLSDCRGCRSYKEDAVPLLLGRSSKSEDQIVNYAVWHLTP